MPWKVLAPMHTLTRAERIALLREVAEQTRDKAIGREADELVIALAALMVDTLHVLSEPEEEPTDE